MEALILSCGTGGGHNSAGKALEEVLTARGDRVRFLNPYTLAGDHVSSAINNAYISLVQRAPAGFGFVYALGNAYRKLPFRSPVYFANRLMVPYLQRYLEENPCDVIVTTHLFPAEILTNMKAMGIRLPFTVYVATDYTCIPFTEETDCDCYVVPSPEQVSEFSGCGIPQEQILPLGIPVCQAYTQPAAPQDKTAARARLGLDPDAKIILVAGGSIGAGSLDATVSTLLDSCKDAHLVVICGHNRLLHGILSRKYGSRCTILEHTSQMADYMKACDLFVSKPGGLSSTEAANLGIPLIHFTPIPGCETHNMEFFASHGMCLPVHSPRKELAAAVQQLMSPAAQQAMREQQHKWIPLHAAEDICELLEENYALFQEEEEEEASCVPAEGQVSLEPANLSSGNLGVEV